MMLLFTNTHRLFPNCLCLAFLALLCTCIFPVFLGRLAFLPLASMLDEISGRFTFAPTLASESASFPFLLAFASGVDTARLSGRLALGLEAVTRVLQYFVQPCRTTFGRKLEPIWWREGGSEGGRWFNSRHECIVNRFVSEVSMNICNQWSMVNAGAIRCIRCSRCFDAF
jgi:hypothetical protein